MAAPASVATLMFNLVRHDLLILRNSLRAAFSTWRDWLILVFGLILAGAAVRGFLIEVAESGVRWSWWGFAAYFAAVGFIACLYGAHRVAHFAEESPLAGFALRKAPRRAYHAAWLGGLLVASYLPLALLYALASHPALAIALAGGWLAALAGAAASVAWRFMAIRLRRALQRRWLNRPTPQAVPLQAGGRRAGRLMGMAMRRQSVFGRTTTEAAAIIGGAGAAVGLLAFCASRFVSASEAIGFAAGVALVGMLVLSRLSAALTRYLAFVGFAPLIAGLAPVPAMALFLGSLVLSIGLLMPKWIGAAAAVASAVLLLFALIAYVRSLHYRIRSERAADFAIQIEAIAAAMLSFAFAPLAVLFVIARVATLHRDARQATWALP